MALNIDSIIEGATAGVVASVLLGAFAIIRNAIRNGWLRVKAHRTLRFIGYGNSINGVTVSLRNWAGFPIIIREVVMTTNTMEYVFIPTGEASSTFPSEYPRLTRAQKKTLKAGGHIGMPQQRKFIMWKTSPPVSGFVTLAPFTNQRFLLPSSLLKDFNSKVSGVRIVAEYLSTAKRNRILQKTVQTPIAARLQEIIERFNGQQQPPPR